MILDKGYVESTDVKFVDAPMYRFYVWKDKIVILMVYNGTKNKLNKCLFMNTMINSIKRFYKSIVYNPKNIMLILKKSKNKQQNFQSCNLLGTSYSSLF